MSDQTQQSAAPQGCPFTAAAVETSVYYHEGIHDELAQARKGSPVFYDPETEHWIVTRFDDVMHILQDHDHVSAINTSDSASPVHEDALKIMQDGGFAAEKVQSNCDGDRHTRIRNVSAKALNMREFMVLEPQIRALVSAAFDRLDGRDTADLLAELTYELPARVIFLMLGIPDEDIEKVKAWSGTRTLLNFSPSTYDQQISGAQDMVDYWSYCVDMVNDRMKNPKNDVASKLLAVRGGDDSVITVNELTTVVYGLAFAGHETTTSQLTNAFRALLTYRENWEALIADASLIPQAVEEAFRYCGAVIGWRRRTLTDYDIGGVTIPKDANIILSFGSANRDDKMFPDPDRFDVTRKNARRHLTMGNGKHHCLGAPLARLEMKIVLEEATRRFPDMRLVEGVDMDFARTYVFQAPRALPVTLGK